MSKMKIAVLASGRGSNLQAIIDAIAAERIKGEIVLVLSDKADAYALERAKAAAIPTAVLLPSAYDTREAYDVALAEQVAVSGAQLVVLAGFMRILSAAFLERFPNKVVNIHPALLPSFTGLRAQEQAFVYGVKISGCTVHFVDCGMDSGPIIAQTAVDVSQCTSADEVAARILIEEHKLYPAVVGLLADGKVRVNGRRVVCEQVGGVVK